MATWQHLRSSTANKRPTTSLADGRIAINTNTASPGLFFKDSAGTGIVKVGPVHVGTTAPNSVPAAGGSSGNYTGEQWLDTSVSPAQMKVWNGSTWVGIVADELPVSKLQDGAARQLIQTDAAGTGVEWTSDVDVPGTLDVTSTATFDSIAQHPLGTAGAPTITFTGDNNTGIYSPGADQVAISTGGSGRLFVDASGNVGVGTSTIAGKLSLGASQDFVFGNQFSTGTGGTGRLVATGGEVYIQAGLAAAAGSNAPIIFTGYGGVGERLRITAAGLVGVGTSNPNSTLHVAGSLTVNDRVFLQRASGSLNLAIANYWDGSTNPLTGTKGDIVAIGNAGGDGVAFVNANTERMRLTSTGLGIGVSGPLKKTEIRSTPTTADTDGLRVGDGTRYLEFAQTGATYNYMQVGANQNLIYFSGSNLSLSTDGANAITLNTNSLERVRVTSAGNVGIGNNTPDTTLTVGGTNAAIRVQPSNVANAQIFLRHGSIANNSGLEADNTGALAFYANGSERSRIDNSGRLLVGTSSASSNSRAVFQGRSTTDVTGQGVIYIQRGSSAVGFTGGEGLADIVFADSNAYAAAAITCQVDGTWGSGGTDNPGRLVFSVTPDGLASPKEAMRIRNNGEVNIGTFDTGYLYVQYANGTPSFINRTGNDGTLLSLRQDGTEEGTISVSGTTVSYNGAHLSRWSQLPSGAERIEILRGSVLSNINEMCEWGDEDNEQLNRMKVSDVEGDKNVSGVFQAWDDDDDTYTNDFYCAMTGDFIIRIGAGVTVERGDLLMSAGDGTAKPQDDDIIRSKTIAKVTSTTVSCTYEDGSYCVPCVLMAC